MASHAATLITPQFTYCPVCSAGKSQHSGFQLGLCARLPDGRLAGPYCKHEFSLHDALKSEISSGNLGIVATFANWLHAKREVVESGKICRVKISMPQGMSPFATFLTASTSSDHPNLHVVPSVVGIVGDELLMAVPGAAGTAAQSLGAPVEMSVFAYAYASVDAPGWKRLFYDSLKDLAERRYSLSIFKLATSIELYADVVFEAYLANKSLPPALSDRLLGSARNWDSRAHRIGDIAASLLPAEATKFRDALPDFKKLVRKPRNNFAHAHAGEATYEDACGAYEAAFEVLWMINQLALVLQIP